MKRYFLSTLVRLAKMVRPRTPRIESTEIRHFVSRQLDRRHQYLDWARRVGTPLYLIDKNAMVSRVIKFTSAFKSVLPDTRVLFAMKCNSHPEIVSTAVESGCGVDVSSGQELRTALTLGATRIVFSGPGKTDEELSLAVTESATVTVLIDSFAELERLNKAAADQKRTVFAGVRLTTDNNGIWRKFGVPLSHLPAFFIKAAGCQNVRLGGVQFHLSWNLRPDAYVSFLRRLGTTLKSLEPAHRRAIEFIDIGGGFWPTEGEWLQPAATWEGKLHEALGLEPATENGHFKLPAASIKEFASAIAAAFDEHFPSDMNFRVYVEPGRWLCNDAMHLLLKVIDRKAADLVITDGGTNAVGWERFESDYFPVINLSRPALTEKNCLVAGSLCTPHDIWGYGYYGEDIKPGDILLIPNQGAYTYSLRQEFIKPLPSVAVVSGKVTSASSGDLSAALDCV